MNKIILAGLAIFWQLNILSAEPSLEKYFIDENLKGSITIYELNGNKWIYSDKKDAFRETLPASTFKIPHLLIALQEKIINPDTVFLWDKKERSFGGKPVAVWNQNTDIIKAFKNSTVWFFVEISKKIDRNTYRKYLQRFSYGNQKLDGENPDFWNYGEFAISPKNQIEFMINLYKNTLPISGNHTEYIKYMMIDQKNDDYTLRGKTGWGKKNGLEIGWYVGYVETKSSTVFFATRIISESQRLPENFGKIRREITMKVLRNLRYIP
jgi:beta-lactamase class D